MYRLIAIVVLVFQIASSVAAQEPNWIWGGPVDPRSDRPEICEFRRSFEVGGIQEAELEITCDNSYVLRINGRLIGIGNDWQQLDRYDILPLLRSGTNQVTIRAHNLEGPAGLVVRIRMRDAEGREQVIVSDASWQAARQKSGTWDPSATRAAWQAATELGTLADALPWRGQVVRSELLRQVPALREGPRRTDWKLRDGDRVVLLGSTWVERAQQFGYLETLVATALPDQHVTFRNLGWSGDTVFGHARARFGTVEEGFQQLEVQVHQQQPTLILVGYGTNESFQGSEGIEQFSAGLERLLDVLEATGAAVVLVTPPPMEQLPPPLPDVDEQNHHLRRYSQVIEQAAAERGLPMIDLFGQLEAAMQPGGSGPVEEGPAPSDATLTENAIHLSDFGYQTASRILARGLGVRSEPWQLDIHAGSRSYDAQGLSIHEANIGDDGFTLLATSRHLPAALTWQADLLPRVRVRGLRPGHYRLTVDGEPIVSLPAEAWGQGVRLSASDWSRSPDGRQLDELRQAIARKNELFFHRWRPQNETYLFLFRKHEQGNNAVEIPQFDPLIAQQEERIAKLRQPVPHRYELEKMDE